MTDAETRIRSTTSRLDSLLDVISEETRRREQDDRRNQAMLDAEKRIDTQAKYDEIFQAYGHRAPAPVADQDPMDFKFSLMRRVKSQLARDDDRPVRPGSTTTVGDMARLRLGELPDTVLNTVERDLIDAAKLQAESPALSTLPPPGQFVERVRTDEMTGAREIRWHGRESFIKSMGTPGRKVLRLVNPVTGEVLIGPPRDRIR